VVKQNASLDASFWINACAAAIVEHLLAYFTLYATNVVIEEIRYPLDILGIESYSSILFTQWVHNGMVSVANPESSVSWYHQGENAAIALAIERNYFLLIDDANPYHHAKAAGLQVVGTAEFIVFLFDKEQLPFDKAVAAIRQLRISKGQRRNALEFLERLRRLKEKQHG
jgi:predicted nucleic acid-binding protein